MNINNSELSENSKSFEIVTSDQSGITNKFLPMASLYKTCESENNLHNNNFLKSITNSRHTPDCSENSDNELFDIFTNNHTIVCSRSTQTAENDYKQTTTNILLTTELNQPATISNASIIRRTATPSNQHNQELILTKSQLYNIHRNYQKLKSRFHKLHADYQKLAGITGILTTSLQKSVAGESVNLQETLQNCEKIYPDIFNVHIHDYNAAYMDPNTNLEVINKNLQISMLNTVPVLPKFLDYKKIKLHFTNGNFKIRLLLLQALRWKITLSQSSDRDETMEEYIKNDLLGLREVTFGNSGKPILSHLLNPMDPFIPYPLQQSTARLLNTFASLKSGRDYLSAGPDILNAIVQCLDSARIKAIDAFTCDMIIATLQKLSLRKCQRLYMISAGLVEWLVYHLKAEYQIMGSYRLEYVTALLMNLSLQKEAQIRAAAMADTLMSTLIMILSSEHLPALPYVNGALNNFLANSDINEEARIIGLGSILEYHRQYRSGELRKHLDHILMRHRRKNNEMIIEDLNDDDDREELDILEDELDEMDPVKVEPGDLFGESILASCYSVSLKVLQNDNKFTKCSIYKTCNESTEVYDEKASYGHYSLPERELPTRENSLIVDTLNTTNEKLATDKVSEKFKIVDDHADGLIKDSSMNDPKAIPELIAEGEDAFTAKPKITRTPQHHISS